MFLLDYPETISDLPDPLLALSMDSLVGLRYKVSNGQGHLREVGLDIRYR